MMDKHGNKTIKHERPVFQPWEQYVTCCHCAKPLDDNQRMKDALQVNTAAGWAKCQLRLLAQLASGREVPQWCVDEIRRIGKGIRLIDDETLES